MQLISCGCYISDKERKDFLRYILDNYDDVETKEKLEALKYLYSSDFTIIYDEEYEKIYVYGNGEMNEVKDKELKDWIEDELFDWSIFFNDVIK